MSTSIADLSAYRAAKALRECGQNSQTRSFLWTMGGASFVQVFNPARAVARWQAPPFRRHV